MKKHILGLALFSLIVGLTIFISAMFYRSQKNMEFYVSETRYCKLSDSQEGKNNPAPVKIVQAVFNSRTKQIDIEFLTSHQQNINIGLFYERQGQEKKIEKSLFHLEELNSKIDSEGKSILSIDLPSKWLNDLKQTDNIYVSIVNVNKFTLSSTFSNEVPVLMIQK